MRNSDDAPLRVALVLDRFEPRRGGLESWTFQLAAWLSRAGHQVHAVCFSASAEGEPFGITAHALPAVIGREARAAAMASFLARLPVDLIHDTGVSWHYDVLQPQGGSRIGDWRQNQRSRRPFERAVQLCHPAGIRRRREFRRLEARQYHAATGTVVAVSRGVRQDLMAFEKVPPQRIRVIYNGIDTTRFVRDDAAGAVVRRQLALQPGPLFVLVAHNFRLKGVTTALRALALLRRAALGAQLLIIGRDPDVARRRLATSLGVADRVRFLGHVDDVRPYLSAADACIHPAFYDPCSLATLEALSMGLPVVTTRRNGVSELMTDGREGFVIAEPDDAEALARHMGTLDPTRCAGMRPAARHLACAYDLEQNFSAILALYREILAARRHGSAVPRLAAGGH
jgi:UDP-glucose:(heptosyl)LPS alpha-1,3-glucosyltransferase